MVGDKLAAHAPTPITYVVGDASIEILDAVVGATGRETTSDGVTVRATTRDYFVPAVQLSIDGERFEPSRGHQIYDDGQLYEVQPVGPDGCWRFSDRDHARYRIHTRWLGSVEQ